MIQLGQDRIGLEKGSDGSWSVIITVWMDVIMGKKGFILLLLKEKDQDFGITYSWSAVVKVNVLFMDLKDRQILQVFRGFKEDDNKKRFMEGRSQRITFAIFRHPWGKLMTKVWRFFLDRKKKTGTLGSNSYRKEVKFVSTSDTNPDWINNRPCS